MLIRTESGSDRLNIPDLYPQITQIQKKSDSKKALEDVKDALTLSCSLNRLFASV